TPVARVYETAGTLQYLQYLACRTGPRNLAGVGADRMARAPKRPKRASPSRAPGRSFSGTPWRPRLASLSTPVSAARFRNDSAFRNWARPAAASAGASRLPASPAPGISRSRAGEPAGCSRFAPCAGAAGSFSGAAVARTLILPSLVRAEARFIVPYRRGGRAHRCRLAVRNAKGTAQAPRSVTILLLP